MFRKFKHKNIKIFKLLIIAVIAIGVLIFYFSRGSTKLLSVSPDISVKPIKLSDGLVIDFPYTDDNGGENIIIKTDRKDYYGMNSSDVYISITNTRNIAEKAVLLFYFPKPEDGMTDDKLIPRVNTLQQYNNSDWKFVPFFKENIKINPELLSVGLKKRESIPQTLAINTGAQIEIPANQTIYFKSKIQYPEDSQGEFWIETVGTQGGYGLLDPWYYDTTKSSDTASGWYSSNWTYRKKFIIDYKKVAGGSNLPNFPVLIAHTDLDIRTTTFGGKSASGSGEFIFTTSDGTTSIPYEIERYSSFSGEFVGWVNVTTLSATADTGIYMYYGGAAAGGATNQNKTGVWDSNFQGVYHLTSLTNDSTVNANNGTNTGVVAATGKIGNGGDFDGTDYIALGTNQDFHPNGTASYTISGWFEYDDTGGDPTVAIFSRWNDPNSGDYHMSITSGFLSRKTRGVSPFSITGGTSLAANTWYYMAAVYDGTNARIKLNGKNDAGPTALGSIGANSDDTYIGAMEASDVVDFHWDGTLDEVRFATIARTDGWIATEYNNQTSPRTFYTIGGQEKITSNTVKYGTTVSADTKPNWYISGSNTWKNRIKFTIPAKNVYGGSDLSNFPFLLSFTEADIKTTANGGRAASGSGEFVITSSNGTTVLPHEIDTYSATTGEFIGWVNITTLSASQDTVLYFYYNGPNSGATNQNKTGTWNTNYELVIHGGNGTTLNITDSSSNANATVNQSATATTGIIGGGIYCNGTTYFTVTHHASINIETYTISAWLRNIAGDNGDAIMAKFSSATTYPYNLAIVSNAAQLQDSFDGIAGFTINALTAIGTVTPMKYVVTRRVDGGTVDIYTNTKREDTDTDGASGATTNTNNVGVCARADGAATTSGIFDEIRISSVADGTGQSGLGWMETEFNNQSFPRRSYAIGRPEAFNESGNNNNGAPGQIKSR